MARYHRTRSRPYHYMNTPDTQDREDSGVQLDEPCSPSVAKQQGSTEELVTMRHGVTITKIPKNKPLSTTTSETNRETNSMVKSSHRCTMNSSETNGCGGQHEVASPSRSSKLDVKSLIDDTRSLRLCKGRGKSDSNLCYSVGSRGSSDGNGVPEVVYRHRRGNANATSSHSSKVKQSLNLEEDEGVGIRDSNSDIIRGEYSYGDSVTNESDSTDPSSEPDSETPRFSLAGDSLDGDQGQGQSEGHSANNTSDTHKQHSVKSEKTAEKTDKYSKKRKFRSMLPALRRSQSVGCESDLVPDQAVFSEAFPGNEEGTNKGGTPETSEGFRRMIHKTCSADAAMMASEVLPLDPQELVRNKQKSSIARNMRKKLQKLKRRNTDSLLGAAIMSVRGTNKTTHADAVEWGSSFESLLTDKNGIELFRNFLKSEFSEENIEFWIACEEFKSIRTNKLTARAQRIYSDFIAVKAPKQVNLDSKTRLDAVTSLENPTRDMFKQAQKRIQYLMENDSYKRFLETQSYLSLLGKSSA